MIYIIYVEYHELYQKYIDVLREYDEIINEAERLFATTQPKAVDFNKERVSGGNQSNVFENYVIEKERKNIDERLEEVKVILDERKTLLKLKEQDLRSSKDWQDVIYVYHYLDKLSITQISYRIPYSRQQVWRILKKIRFNLK